MYSQRYAVLLTFNSQSKSQLPFLARFIGAWPVETYLRGSLSQSSSRKRIAARAQRNLKPDTDDEHEEENTMSQPSSGGTDSRVMSYDEHSDMVEEAVVNTVSDLYFPI